MGGFSNFQFNCYTTCRLRSFLFSPTFDFLSLVAEWLTSVRPGKTFPTYNQSFNSDVEHVIHKSIISRVIFRQCVRFQLGFKMQFTLHCRKAQQMQVLRRTMYTKLNPKNKLIIYFFRKLMKKREKMKPSF